MESENISQRLLDLIPGAAYDQDDKLRKAAETEANRIVHKISAKELAQAAYREKMLRNKTIKDAERQGKFEEAERIKREEKTAIEALKEQHDAAAKAVPSLDDCDFDSYEPLPTSSSSSPSSPIRTMTPSQILEIQNAKNLEGVTRPEVAKLLNSLNINVSVQLSKQDTANLLACLLTCNETQLDALYKNKKIPIVVRTYIKRLKEDANNGYTDTIERLWDRIFGKGPMKMDLPEKSQLETGILPNVPVSREAYIIIRDTLMK